MAGTDHLRRDLMVALLWGTPVALAFGLVAALGTTITTMAIAAIATWFGGWVDAHHPADHCRSTWCCPSCRS